MSFIKLENIEKKFKLGETQIKAVNNISLEIHRGDFVSILGPSGSGKSTLLHLIGALEKPSKGAVHVGKQNLAGYNDRQAASFRNKSIGFVFQTFNLISSSTALENVALPLIFSGITGNSAKKIARTALEAVGLGERVKHRPNQLSGGELQRVAIARAITNNPPIILADEPTGNLDSKSGKAIMQILQTLNQKGHTIIMVTHNRTHAKYAKRVIELLDGKIISDERKKHTKK